MLFAHVYLVGTSIHRCFWAACRLLSLLIRHRWYGIRLRSRDFLLFAPCHSLELLCKIKLKSTVVLALIALLLLFHTACSHEVFFDSLTSYTVACKHDVVPRQVSAYRYPFSHVLAVLTRRANRCTGGLLLLTAHLLGHHFPVWGRIHTKVRGHGDQSGFPFPTCLSQQARL